MPEYLAPGVYVEETSFRAKSIEGVSTTTTGFIGPARYGPIDLEPDIITGLGEFERIYGDRQKLIFSDAGEMDNYLWHSARAFFEEGGKRLYIVRTFTPLSGDYPPKNAAGEIDFITAPTSDKGLYHDGHGRGSLPSTGGRNAIQIRARFPGDAGNMLIRVTVRLGQNVLGGEALRNPDGSTIKNPDGSPKLKATVKSLQDNEIVWISDITSPISSPPGSGTLYIAQSSYDPIQKEQTWNFTSPVDTRTINMNAASDLTPSLDPETGDQVRVVTLTVTAVLKDGTSLVWDGLAPDPKHVRDGVPDSFDKKFGSEPSNLAQARALPIVVTVGDGVDGLELLDALFQSKTDLRAKMNEADASEKDLSVELLLEKGNDGKRPSAGAYEGFSKLNEKRKTGLKVFEDIEDISIVAAPGSTYRFEDEGYRVESSTIINLLIAHAARMRYRIAVLDSGDGQTIAQVRAMRAKIDSTYAALYYPWIKILDPVTRQEIGVPPSGHVAGIYARNDINRAVYKAPANEVVNLAIGFELLLNKSQQEVLNPEGINCFRFFEGRGFRLWGARTISSDPEWKYVNLRRYFAYLERSIDRGTQWAVFEPNGDALWANVRLTIQDFLFNEWVSGALLGEKPEKAYFVRCDRSTMTQNDLDNGRLVCLIGVAVVKPAEFVIFRIGQWTADARR
jgi:phage tail sheath protein FI